MDNIVGISAFGMNPAACVLKDGEVIAFAEEERFTRRKSSENDFPLNALEYCLNEAELGLVDIDNLAFGWDYNKYRFEIPVFYIKQFFCHLVRLSPSDTQIKTVINELIRNHPVQIRRKTLANLGLNKEQHKIGFHYVDHHLAHAISAFYSSGFERSDVLIVDGSGEKSTLSFYTADKSGLQLQHRLNIPDSLGWFYAAFSDLLGFKPYEQAGYLMGLAPYGRPDEDLSKKMEQILTMESGLLKIDPKYTLLGRHSYSEHYSDELASFFNIKPREAKQIEYTQKEKNIAFAAQKRIEEVVLQYLQKWQHKTQTKNLCLAGGVALNVKMNGEIIKEGIYSEIYVQPVSHDAGTALGAALHCLLDNKESRKKISNYSMDHVYWGPSFSDDEIEQELKRAKIKYKKLQNITRKAAKALSENKIVACFQGRMEVGPRALGNRSILANPLNKKMHSLINKNVKFRDTWRPFCPSVLKEDASKYFEKAGEEGAFMGVAYTVKKNIRHEIPAVVHVDFSARPQLVDKSTNQPFYRLIKEFGRLTGHNLVLNTSFNVKGEPIVCTPQEALKCFYSTGLDAMAIGSFWLEK